MPLFDGKPQRVEGSRRKSAELKVVDGQLVREGPRCHLFYDGERPFKNFHFIAEVKTRCSSNAGIYFHTKYQATDWPKQGFECQVNVSHKDPKKTSSLYAVVNVADPGVKDNEWCIPRRSLFEERTSFSRSMERPWSTIPKPKGKRLPASSSSVFWAKELLPCRLMILTAKFTSGIYESRKLTDYLRDSRNTGPCMQTRWMSL